MAPTCMACGNNSRNSSSRLPASWFVAAVNPVKLPPGRARLATKPSPTGSRTGENDRDRCRRFLACQGRRRAAHHDQVDFLADSLGAQRRIVLIATLGGPIFDHQVLALD